MTAKRVHGLTDLDDAAVCYWRDEQPSLCSVRIGLSGLGMFPPRRSESRTGRRE
jgi:hypothetical protein